MWIYKLKRRWLIGIIFLMSLILVFKIIVILDDNYLQIDDKIHELAISEVITLQLERDDNTKIIIEWSLWELQSDQMSKSYNLTNEQLMYIKEEYTKFFVRIIHNSFFIIRFQIIWFINIKYAYKIFSHLMYLLWKNSNREWILLKWK